MKYISYLLIAFLLSCQLHTPQKRNVADTLQHIVTFTPEQLEMAEIKTGTIEKRKLSAFVECNGTVELPPQNLATVCAPAGGIIKTMYFIAGQKVNKGEVMLTLQNAEYIKLQQNYLEALGQLEYYKAEFERQGELTVENAASVKKMQQAQSDYKTIDARKASQKVQLELLGIDADKLKAETISSEIELKAPISGYVSKVNANIGKYVNMADAIYEIADNSHMHLSLKVFEKDVANVRVGQMVMFMANANRHAEYKAKVEVVGHVVDPQTRAVEVHAHLLENNSILCSGMYVYARIFTSDMPVICLPAKAFVKDENKYFIFVKHKGGFVKTPVEIGVEEKEYVELKNIDAKLLSDTIVVDGAYYLNSEHKD
jgi:cobalt-zinc-cadmium efflux system membrane fusion protein